MADSELVDQENSQTDPWLLLRRRMVEDQLRARGIRDARVLNAMMAVPRERFIPPDFRVQAYEDRALPVGNGQTISQPYIVAYMTELLAPTSSDRVLEIGTGTGYQTAVLALLCRQVYTIERIAALHERAAAVLTDLNIKNVSLSVGDGSLGLPESAPFDRIIVTAAAPTVPKSLMDQLVDEGRLVIPVGSDREQTVVRVIRHGQRTIETPMLACRFVKLIGSEGWTPEGDFKT